MRNFSLETQLIGIANHGVGPLAWWRTIHCLDFAKEARIVETAVASIVAITRLAPPDLIAELSMGQEEELAPAWNDLAMLFFGMDGMALGLNYEIGGSCAALAALHVDPLGAVLLLKALSEPYVTCDPDTRIWVASTWLAERGSLLNQSVLSGVDWWQSARGYQQQAYAEDGE